jgi:hypothetical protein
MGNREYVIIESVSDFINYIFNEMQVEDKKRYILGENKGNTRKRFLACTEMGMKILFLKDQKGIIGNS